MPQIENDFIQNRCPINKRIQKNDSLITFRVMSKRFGFIPDIQTALSPYDSVLSRIYTAMFRFSNDVSFITVSYLTLFWTSSPMLLHGGVYYGLLRISGHPEWADFSWHYYFKHLKGPSNAIFWIFCPKFQNFLWRTMLVKLQKLSTKAVKIETFWATDMFDTSNES